ncbi:MAG: MBL fold metallo-hydrolase [Deltaproteobacteria bacterium]|nr:MBL fold metallo-hydrolase [Deltaproteobacteria bacterium]
MCLIRKTIQQCMSRRAFLQCAGALAAAPFLTGWGVKAALAASPGDTTRPGAGNFHTRLVLLGTAGGPVWYPRTNRMSTSTALIVGDTIYLVDLGHGATGRMAEAFNSGIFVNTPGGKVEEAHASFLKNADALFFTHLHMDHTADYPTLLLIGQSAGLGNITVPGQPAQPLKVFGPGDRGQLDDNKTGYQGAIVETPSGSRTPGTKEMTSLLWQAFSQSINDFTLDNGLSDFTTLVDVHDIGWTGESDIMIPLPRNGLPDPTRQCSPYFIDPNTTPCPPMEPFKVYENRDINVSVRATLVDHHQVFPSLAYRFDTPDGSVVISGDTGANTCGNLKRLAQGADVLVHEVIDEAWIEILAGTGFPGPLIEHLNSVHTKISEVGGVAEECGVRTLVLNHIVPGNAPVGHLVKAKQGFSGELIIGEDLMQIGIGKARRANQT